MVKWTCRHLFTMVDSDLTGIKHIIWHLNLLSSTLSLITPWLIKGLDRKLDGVRDDKPS